MLQSSEFHTLWNQSIRFAHAQLLSVLKGNSKAVTTSNGQVVLDLVPLLEFCVTEHAGVHLGRRRQARHLADHHRERGAQHRLPTDRQGLEQATPAQLWSIPLFPAKELDQARHTVRIFDRVTVWLLVLTPVVAALALWLSRRRRRTLLQLSAGGLLGLVVIRRVVIWLQSALEAKGVPANRPARRAILDYLFREYFSVSRWILVGLLIVFLIALVTGPYPWAVTSRSTVARFAKEGWNVLGAAYGHARGDATVSWVVSHLDLLRILGVALAVVLLLALSVSWIGFLIIVVLLGAYELWLRSLGQRAQALAAATDAAESSTTVPPDDQPHSPKETGLATPV